MTTPPDLTASADVSFWQQQTERLESDARRLRLVALACLAGAAMLAPTQVPSVVALGLLLLGLSVAAMAAYMVGVRRQECRQGLAEARLRLREPSTQPSAHEPKGAS